MKRPIGSVLLIALSGVGVATLSLPADAGFGNETVNYTYDGRGQLVSVRHNGSVNNNLVANYQYDNAENRNSYIVTGSANPPP